jgi:hypothetical protein
MWSIWLLARRNANHSMYPGVSPERQVAGTVHRAGRLEVPRRHVGCIFKASDTCVNRRPQLTRLTGILCATIGLPIATSVGLMQRSRLVFERRRHEVGQQCNSQGDCGMMHCTHCWIGPTWRPIAIPQPTVGLHRGPQGDKQWHARAMHFSGRQELS